MMTFRKARGFYLKQLVAREINEAQYWRLMRAIAHAERAAKRDKLADLEKKREAVRASKAKAKLRRELQQSLQECA